MDIRVWYFNAPHGALDNRKFFDVRYNIEADEDQPGAGRILSITDSLTGIELAVFNAQCWYYVEVCPDED